MLRYILLFLFFTTAVADKTQLKDRRLLKERLKLGDPAGPPRCDTHDSTEGDAVDTWGYDCATSFPAGTEYACGNDDCTQAMVDDPAETRCDALFLANTMCCECGGGVCKTGEVEDACGVCGGDGSTCDVCGVVGGDGTGCDDRCGIPAGNDYCVAAIEAAHDTSAITATAISEATAGIIQNYVDTSPVYAQAISDAGTQAVTAYQRMVKVYHVPL